jgi:hypothetical protein
MDSGNVAASTSDENGQIVGSTGSPQTQRESGMSELNVQHEKLLAALEAGEADVEKLSGVSGLPLEAVLQAFDNPDIVKAILDRVPRLVIKNLLPCVASLCARATGTKSTFQHQALLLRLAGVLKDNETPVIQVRNLNAAIYLESSEKLLARVKESLTKLSQNEILGGRKDESIVTDPPVLGLPAGPAGGNEVEVPQILPLERAGAGRPGTARQGARGNRKES